MGYKKPSEVTAEERRLLGVAGIDHEEAVEAQQSKDEVVLAAMVRDLLDAAEEINNSLDAAALRDLANLLS
jgi:hypothetical protein